ncbi:proline-rich receptor-like protein kinase PERK12 [Gracilaria domingensis]|nr:proline-rich receptor-like protein kinase PERK12 [Gracilaria domingensis]
MIHGLKVSLAKGTTKKKIIKEDESLSATKNTLYLWRTSVQSLLGNIVANEEAWNSIFNTFSSFETVGSSIYPENDVPVLTLLKDLQTAKSRLDSPESSTVEPNFNAVQRLDMSKKELNALIVRIDNAEEMHERRVDVIRQHKYYEAKTRQMLQSEAKRRNPISQKELERRSRNQTKVQDLAKEMANMNTNIYAEMDGIEVERLAVTDRALSAMLLLQRHYFEAYPVKSCIAKADEIGLGHRVLLRTEHRPWISSDNKGQLNGAQSPASPPNVPYPPYSPSAESTPFPRVDTAPTAPPPDDVSSGYGASYSPMPQSPPPPPPPPPSSNGFASSPHTAGPQSYAMPSTSPRTSNSPPPPPPRDYVPPPSVPPVSGPQTSTGYDAYMSRATPTGGALDSNSYRPQPPNSTSNPLNYHSSQIPSASGYHPSAGSYPPTSSAANYSSTPPRPTSASFPVPPSAQTRTPYESPTISTPPPPPAPPSAYETPGEGPRTSQNRMLSMNSKGS